MRIGFELVAKKPMHESNVICPWIVPRANEVLRSIFDANDSRLEGLAARDCLYTEAARASHVSHVVSGMLSQGVINYRLNKPLAMNLYPEGSIQGFLNLFTSEPAPRLVKAITKSTVRSINRERFREWILADKDLMFEYIQYAEVVGKSELIGMEALFSLPLADRFLLFCASTLFHTGVNPLEASDDYLKLPVRISRAALCNIIYTTKAPLDRLLSSLAKNDLLLRKANDRYVRRQDLAAMCEWILTR